MSQETLVLHRVVWKKKPILRLLYTQWYKMMVEHLKQGRTLEVGGGSGNLKEFAPNVLSTDIVHVPWLDVAADAQSLPFSNGCFNNIVLFDVLHHIENPVLFFSEAIRVLQPGGRIVIMDPYVSWVSWPIYHFLHPEPVDFSQDPLEVRPADPKRKPFDSNQAISKIMFELLLPKFREKFPQISLIHKRYLAFFVYPLSGGFEHRSLIPLTMAKPLLRFERLFESIGRFLAFRVLLVLEIKQ